MKRIAFYGTSKITCYVLRSEESLLLYSNVQHFIKMTFKDHFMSSAFIKISLIKRMKLTNTFMSSRSLPNLYFPNGLEKKDFVLSH